MLSTDANMHFPSGCSIPYISLECESNILKFPSEVLKTATVLQLMVNKEYS